MCSPCSLTGLRAQGPGQPAAKAVCSELRESKAHAASMFFPFPPHAPLLNRAPSPLGSFHSTASLSLGLSYLISGRRKCSRVPIGIIPISEKFQAQFLPWHDPVEAWTPATPWEGSRQVAAELGDPHRTQPSPAETCTLSLPGQFSPRASGSSAATSPQCQDLGRERPCPGSLCCSHFTDE